MDIKGKGKNSLAFQLLMIFTVSIILTDILSFFLIRNVVESNYMNEKISTVHSIETELDKSLKEYTSYDWVLSYFLSHPDVEFDLEYEASVKTNSKIKKLLAAHPGIDIRTVTEAELDAFPEEDKKLYAEIVYNRWLLRINDIKSVYDCLFMHFFATDEEYKNDVFIISGSDGKTPRGTEMGTVYIYGTRVVNTEDQTNTFKGLKEKGPAILITANYLDAYRYMFDIDNQPIIAGITIEISDVKKNTLVMTIQFLITFIVLELISFFLLRYLIFQSIIHPLKGVEKSVLEYTSSKNGKHVRDRLSQIKTNNEIGVLADGISDMTKEIEDYLDRIQTVTAENQRIRADLDMAQKIQADMLPNVFPPFPDNTEFDIYATMKPAKEVGGDFYDFFMVDDDHLALVIADVSGKGVPASLFMVNAKTLIKNRTKIGGRPADIIADVSEQLLDVNEEGMFVTVWLAVIDIHTGKGVVVNAGHEHPVLKHKDGSYELIKYRHSMAVAMIRGVPYNQHDIQLEPGDRIFVYTDGLPEARRGDGEFFGTDRMIEAMNKYTDADLHDLLVNMKKEVDIFVDGEEQYDDMTMLGFDFRG